jgi:hypothetical protein
MPGTPFGRKWAFAQAMDSARRIEGYAPTEAFKADMPSWKPRLPPSKEGQRNAFWK